MSTMQVEIVSAEGESGIREGEPEMGIDPTNQFPGERPAMEGRAVMSVLGNASRGIAPQYVDEYVIGPAILLLRARERPTVDGWAGTQRQGWLKAG